MAVHGSLELPFSILAICFFNFSSKIFHTDIRVAGF